MGAPQGFQDFANFSDRPLTRENHFQLIHVHTLVLRELSCHLSKEKAKHRHPLEPAIFGFLTDSKSK